MNRIQDTKYPASPTGGKIQDTRYKIPATSKGFTLVEVTVAMAIFSIILVITTSIVVSGFKLTGRGKAIKDVEQQSRFSLAEMERKLKFADPGSITPANNANSPDITAKFLNSDGSTRYTLKFERISPNVGEVNQLKATTTFTSGLTETRDLTDKNIDVSSLSFDTTKAGVIAIKLEARGLEQFRAENAVPPQPVKFSDKISLQTKVTLRNVPVGVTTRVVVKAAKSNITSPIYMTVSALSISDTPIAINTIPLSGFSSSNDLSPLSSNPGYDSGVTPSQKVNNSFGSGFTDYKFEGVVSNADLIRIDFNNNCVPFNDANSNNTGQGCGGGDPDLHIDYIIVYSPFQAESGDTWYEISRLDSPSQKGDLMTKDNPSLTGNNGNRGLPLTYTGNKVIMYRAGNLFIPIVNMGPRLAKIRDLRRTVDAKMLKRAIEGYKVDNGNYPCFPNTVCDGLNCGCNYPWGNDIAKLANALVSTSYLNAIPKLSVPSSASCRLTAEYAKSSTMYGILVQYENRNYKYKGVCKTGNFSLSPLTTWWTEPGCGGNAPACD